MATPKIFNFQYCLDYLNRSELECLHQIEDKSILKLIKIRDEPILVKVSQTSEKELVVDVITGKWLAGDELEITRYIEDWFDLAVDLKSVYRVLKQDKLLAPLLESHEGLRMIAVVDLFEALSWAIIGQQINLTFAYQVKKMLVEECGQYLEYDNQRYYLFPTPNSILDLSEDDFKRMKFSRQKIRYIRLVAEKLVAGEWDKNSLGQLSDPVLKKELMSLTGIGAWSANYVMMRCFHVGSAFPSGDAGLHQALTRLMALGRKPTSEELAECAKKWHPWEAYATFYLWRSLHMPKVPPT